MSDFVTYEVNKSDLEYVQKKLGELKNKSPRVIKNAVNHTAKEARTKLASGAQEAYTVTNGGFNSRMKIKNASVSNLTATITSQDKTLTITRFHTSTPKSGSKADIVNSGLKELVGPERIRAFKRNGLIMQRKGASRYPVKVLRSISVPKMIEQVYEGNRGVNKALKSVIQESLHDNIRAEIKKLV